MAILVAGQSGQGEKELFWNNPFYTGCSSKDLVIQKYQLFKLIFSFFYLSSQMQSSTAICSCPLLFH